MKRFSIWVCETGRLPISNAHYVELLQVDANPKAIAAALEQKRENGVNKYSSVRIVDNGEAAP